MHRDVVRDARLEWRRLPANWGDSPFLGNGLLGVQVYAGRTPDELKLVLGHSEVQDQRDHWEAAIGLSRLPVGFLTLRFAGAITAVDWTLDLWNAELTGSVTTTQGSATFTMLVHNARSTFLASVHGDVTWGFQPLQSSTTRQIRRPADYTANPDPALGTANGVSYAAQPLHAGGGYTTAWQTRDGRFAAHVAYTHPANTHTSDAIREVRTALAIPFEVLALQHRRWWNAYYTRSLVSVPDKLVQRFYWLQLYKMAAATRADAPVVSEWGPWFPEQGNSWTAVWWNLNVQISYPLVNGSNHHELDAVTTTLKRFEHNLELNVNPAYRDGDSYAICHPGDRTLRSGPRYCGVPGVAPNDHTGNLLWACHNVWLSYRHTMDRRILKDVLFPILTKAVNYYARFLVEGADGKLHLPETRSPEYANTADATYDLSLIRWGVRTLLSIEENTRWRDVHDRLTPYSQDASGVRIGRDKALEDSHRHFSHLLWFYPLRELTWDTPEHRALITRTVDLWTSRREAWAGYSYGAASAMYSAMGRPEDALWFLRHFLERKPVGANAVLTENSFYREGGNLAIESPLMSGQAVLEMLVQSHNGVVRVFPAVSSTWADASISSLRTQGAFLVDASRSSGRTDWVRVRSEAGSPLLLEHGITGEVDVRDAHGRRLEHRIRGTAVEIPLRRGQTAVVTRSGTRPDLTPRDVPPNGSSPRWGLP